MKNAKSSIWANTSLYLFYGLLAYVPLHIFLSTWLGTSFGMLQEAKVAKDVLLVFGFGLAVASSISQPWFRKLFKDRLVWLVLAYAALTVGLALIKPTDQDSEILGVVYNLRFLLFFNYAILLAHLFNLDRVRRTAVKIVLLTGAFVVGFGIVQYLLLPDDALTHIGYSRANGVLPAFFIDDKPDLERVMSTIRDPNSLGSYLIIIAPLSAIILFLTKNVRLKRMAAVFLVLTLFCLWFTFSRSAWIGFTAAMVTFLLLTDNKFKIALYKQRTVLIPLITLVIVVFAGALIAFRNSYLVQNVILHADESTVMQDPNELRVRFWGESFREIGEEPLGNGPGTAGLASIRNQTQGVVLNENYYLQIAWEVGVIGIVLFLAILFIVAWRLLEMRHDSYVATALFASLVGLLITNFLLHIWSNEAVAYTWWGLAGLTLSWHKTKKLRTP